MWNKQPRFKSRLKEKNSFSLAFVIIYEIYWKSKNVEILFQVPLAFKYMWNFKVISVQGLYKKLKKKFWLFLTKN